jgi:homeobox protein cut-like
MFVQDQTVKVSEARELEGELQRLKEENAELRKKLGESPNIEAARKKAEARVETLENKVRPYIIITKCR